MAHTTIPVNVITGFLGSGKSTLLNALVNMAGLADTAVIVNEFGEIGIDHQLISSAIDQMVLLENGCVCCEVRGDLVDTLELMDERVAAGTIPPFARVILETTGLADPAPILHTLMIEPRLAGRYHLGRVAATVDAVNGRESIASYAEARKQIAVADIVLVTKTDLARPGEVAALATAIGLVNPRAPRIEVTNGALTMEIARALAGEDGGDIASQISRDVANLDDSHEHGHEHEHDHAAEHTGGIETAAIILDRPIAWSAFTAWIDAVTSLRGPDLLRLKGLVHVTGRKGPVVVHAVQHVVHQPVELANWPDDDTRTRVVCITRNIPPASLTRALEAFTRVPELS
jgi:G3E family GTPase